MPYVFGFLLMIAEVLIGGPCGRPTVADPAPPHAEMGEVSK